MSTTSNPRCGELVRHDLIALFDVPEDSDRLAFGRPGVGNDVDQRLVEAIRNGVGGHERHDGAIEHVLRDVGEVPQERGVAGFGVAQRGVGRSDESDRGEDLVSSVSCDAGLLVARLAERIDVDVHGVDLATEDATVVVDRRIASSY